MSPSIMRLINRHAKRKMRELIDSSMLTITHQSMYPEAGRSLASWTASI